MNTMIEELSRNGVVPVVIIDNAENAEPLGEALLAGGLPCAEITFRTSAARDAIQSMATAFPEMNVGAGTVLSVDQAKQAVDAGAKFIVSPGIDVNVVDWCLQNNIPIFPGVLTPTEVNLALSRGLEVLKFFPAEAAGGLKLLKAIAAPFVDVKFIPTGGITADNLAAYLSLPMVIACGGSWIVEKKLLVNKEFDTITRLVVEAIAIVNQLKGVKA